MKRKFLKFENIDFLTYFSSKHRHMTHEVGVACRTLCNCVIRIGIYIAGKNVATICLIITQLLKLEWGEKSCEVTQHC